MWSRSGQLSAGALLGAGHARAGALLALGIALAVGLIASGSPAEAAFPGANGRIACEGTRAGFEPAPGGISPQEIFSVNPDGSDERVLTDNSTRDGDPAYSPDGTKIAFEGRRVEGQPDNSEIYVANNDGDLSGDDVRRLTFNNGELEGGGRNSVAATDRSPTWSPDGTQIIFHSGRETTFNDGGTTPARDFEIYKMSATTGEQGGLTRLTEHRGQDAIPSWSPDGTKVAFQRQVTPIENFFNLEIFTMDPDGGNLMNISNNPGTPDDPDTPRPAFENSDAIDSFATAWSPDSKRIAFGSTRANETPGNQNFEIYRVNRDGSDVTRLTLNESGDTPGTSRDYDHAPTWSPDGTRILFTSGRTSTESEDEFIAYTMDANLGEAAGLQPVAETGIFARCDWQSLAVAPPPPPVPVPVPPGPAACPVEGAAGYLYPAKMRVLRAQVLREDRVLDVFAPITSRADGDVDVTYQGDRRTDTFDAEVTSGNAVFDRIRFKEPITRGQARLGTGIVTLDYKGDEDTRGEEVRLRAASQRAELDVEQISLIGERLSARGSVTSRAEGIVRFQYSYVDATGTPQIHPARATIQDDGDWELEGDEVPPQLARCGGYLSIQFTGYFERRIRGEQLAYQLNPGQTRNP